jgi:hypothetical protein
MTKELNPHELFHRVAVKGEELDDEWIDDVGEIIRSEGQLVGRQEWDSGGPGAGAGTVDVYQFRGLFISENDVGSYGPYDSFSEAAAAVGLFNETDATTRIRVAAQFEDSEEFPARWRQPPQTKPKVLKTSDPEGEETPEEGLRQRAVQRAEQTRRRVRYGH